MTFQLMKKTYSQMLLGVGSECAAVRCGGGRVYSIQLPTTAQRHKEGSERIESEQLQSPFPRAQSCEAQRGSKENTNGAMDKSYPPPLTLIPVREMGRHSQTAECCNQSIPTSPSNRSQEDF